MDRKPQSQNPMLVGGDDELEHTPENDEIVFAEVRAKKGQVDSIYAAYMLDILRNSYPHLYYRWKRGKFNHDIDFREDLEYGKLLAEIGQVMLELLRAESISTITYINGRMGRELHARLSIVEPGESEWA